MDLISLLSSAIFKSMKTNGKLVICPEKETNRNQDFLFSNQCSVCGKPFQDLVIFSQHMVAHAEEEKKNIKQSDRQYSCRVCNEKFKDSCLLEKHMESQGSCQKQATYDVPLTCNEFENSAKLANRNKDVESKKFGCPFCDE